MIAKEVFEQYEPTIGIECHVQLSTATKLFSASDNDARDVPPNTVVNEIDFGLPGMLPVLNQKAVDLAIKAGLVLNCRIAPYTRFDRKHYFYPDLPKGYQTSQLYHPIIQEGVIEVPVEEKIIKVRINHAHLEEDAGKLTHYNDMSLVDLNRAGTPLIEIVSEPDIHSAKEARAYARELYLLMTYANVTHGDLYHGNMRFDVNISVAPKGSTTLGTRAEIKNLNSFRSVEKVVEYEFKRQVERLESGEKIVQETRGWEEATQKTFSQRSKEDAHDYRYMPDPDIPPVYISEDKIEMIRATLPTLPEVYRKKWEKLELDSSVVYTLLSSQKTAVKILQIQQDIGSSHAKRIANLFASAVDITMENEVNKADVEVDRLVALSEMVEEGKLNSTAAKYIFNQLLKGDDRDPLTIAEAEELVQVSDHAAIEEIVDRILKTPEGMKALEDVKSGNDKAIGYIVGQVMKDMKGKADPSLAQEIIRSRM